jgi:hypothetical protein
MAVKAIQVSSLLRHLLTADEVLFGDPPLFFKQLEQELMHPYYPEIVLGWHSTRPELLSLTDYHLDYSLHEAPVISNDGFDDTNESPTESYYIVCGSTFPAPHTTYGTTRRPRTHQFFTARKRSSTRYIQTTAHFPN